MWNLVLEYFSGFLGKLELAATILLIINVYLIAKQKLVNYFFGFFGVLIYGYIFLEYKLYSDIGLQWLFYAPLQIYGYYVWKYKGTKGLDSLVPTWLTSKQSIFTVATMSVMTLITGYFMSSTDASFPYTDAFTTWMSVVASILLLWKKIENWIYWIIMDVVAVYVYYAKELYVTSGLYVIFLGLATYGLVTWLKESKNNV